MRFFKTGIARGRPTARPAIGMPLRVKTASKSRSAGIALDQDCVGVVRVADVLDPQPVLIAPEAGQRWGPGVLAEHRPGGGSALPGGGVPVLGAGVGAEAGVEGDGGVSGGEDAGQPGAPRGVGANSGLVKAAAA